MTTQGPLEPIIQEPKNRVARFLLNLTEGKVEYDIEEIEKHELMKELEAEFRTMQDEYIDDELVKIWLGQFRRGFIYVTAKLLAEGEVKLQTME